jgi:hypothetical protein
MMVVLTPIKIVRINIVELNMKFHDLYYDHSPMTLPCGGISTSIEVKGLWGNMNLYHIVCVVFIQPSTHLVGDGLPPPYDNALYKVHKTYENALYKVHKMIKDT